MPPSDATSRAVIPRPLRIEALDGHFSLCCQTPVMAAQPELAPMAESFAGFIRRYFGFEPPLSAFTERPGQAVRLKLDDTLSGLGDEGYQLRVGRRAIQVRACRPGGVFYALQTLQQLLPLPAAGQSVSRLPIARVVIKDKPRFQWRGLHLDVARHFMPAAFILKYLDFMAMYKLNVFHWHLSDDQGWRIQIPKYPALTDIGAWREQTLIGHLNDRPARYDGIRHGGFYTPQQIKEIVSYARQRFITVVPEIELPGHAQAAIAAYPGLGCSENKVPVWTSWGNSIHIFNPDEATFGFLTDVLDQVVEWFPGDYLHLGGDEVLTEKWALQPKIRQRTKDLGLGGPLELRNYFFTRLAAHVRRQGKKPIGWDEVLDSGPVEQAVIMAWRGPAGVIKAAQAGLPVIATPCSHLYFDYYQADPGTQPLAIGGYTPLDKVYAFDPVPAQLPPDLAGHILGPQANLWTEYIATPEQVEYMLFPRITALAETAWTAAGLKAWHCFQARLRRHARWYKIMKINYCPQAVPAGP